MSPQLRKPRPVDPESVYTRTSNRLEPAARSCDECRWPNWCTLRMACGQAEKAAMAVEREQGPPVVWTRELVVGAISRWVARYGLPPTTEEWSRKTATTPSYTVVQRLFGTWKAGLAEAGYEPQPSGFQARNRRKQ